MTYALLPSSDASEPPDLAPGLSPRAALEDLRRRLIGYAIKWVWNRDDAEEMVQEAFVISMERGQGPQNPEYGPWMFRTVGNLCMNQRRRRKPESIETWLERVEGETPADVAERAERLTRLREAIERLPPQQRTALILKTEQHMAYPGIARVMELSESSVRGHLHQARRSLAVLLADVM